MMSLVQVLEKRNGCWLYQRLAIIVCIHFLNNLVNEKKKKRSKKVKKKGHISIIFYRNSTTIDSNSMN
jgi:hypothetical protein